MGKETGKKAPMIAVLNEYEFMLNGLGDFLKPKRDNTRVRDNPDLGRALLMERRLQCCCCNGPLKRYSDEQIKLDTLEGVTQELAADLRRTQGRHGYQTEEFIAICPNCGYWVARGTRDFGQGPTMARHALPRIIRYNIDSSDVPISALLTYLARNSDKLLSIDPFKAEELVCDLLRDHLNCEVLHVGGRKDRGIDGYVIAGDGLNTIVQVKWRRDNHGGEGVKVVRELIGTLVSRRVPRGLLVTSKLHLTHEALREIDDAQKSPLVTEGLRLSYKTYADVLAMLALKTMAMENMTIMHPTIALSNARKGQLFG